mmetsp:Transcript_107914/g.186090  ORF Transcript_107914/g.186090 Transcript_107914/m.186090 type:complete len:968 (-) Transcript_107914:1174-4077(-)
MVAAVETSTKSQYIRSPFLDERYHQNKVAPTPFSSQKRHEVRVEKVLPPMSVPVHKPAKTEGEYREKHGVAPYFSCKMTFPYSLTSNMDTRGGRDSMMLNGGRSDGQAHMKEVEDYFSDQGSVQFETADVEADDDSLLSTGPRRQPIKKQVEAAFANRPELQQPNAYWQHPPPTFEPLPDFVSAKPNLKVKDEWHALLANPNAAHMAMITLQAEKFNQATADTAEGTVDSEDKQPSLTLNAATLLSKALFAPLPSHAIPANAASSSNHPKSAGHNCRFKQVPRRVAQSAGAVPNNNYQNRTFDDTNNIVIPPAPAFRTLTPDVQHTLQARGSKTRSKLEHQLQQSHPVMEPPLRPKRPATPVEEESEEEEGEEAEEGDESTGDGSHHSDSGGEEEKTKTTKKKKKKATINETDKEESTKATAATAEDPKDKKKTEVRYNALTGEIEVITNEEDDAGGDDGDAESTDDEACPEWAYSLEECVGPMSQMYLWNSCVKSKGEHENPNVDPTNTNSPADDVVGRRRIKTVTPQLISVYNGTIRRPGMQQYLCGTGLRMGTTLTTTTAPSTSSFTAELPERLKEMNVKNPHTSHGPSSGIGPTPPAAFACPDDPNSFAFKDANLVALVTERGGEVEEVNLQGMVWITESTFVKLADYCPNLKLLNVSGCVQLTNRALAHIARSCQLIAYINIAQCPLVTGEAVSEVIAHCQQLEVFCMHGVTPLDSLKHSAFLHLFNTRAIRALDLSYCATLRDESLVAISNYCPCLEYLNLSGCSGIGDLGVSAIGGKCSNLRVFIMKLCDQESLTLAGLIGISRAPRNLKHLDLSGCTQLDDTTLSFILKQTPCLRNLAVRGCRRITDESINTLNIFCRQLQRLDICSCDNIGLQTLLDLIHDVQSLVHLSVSESCVSKVEVVMLQEIRQNCKVVNKQFVHPPRVKTVGLKPLEDRKRKKAGASSGKGGKEKGKGKGKKK